MAIDLDGTLLGPDGRIAPRDRAAVQRARAAGLDVVIATGRGVVESAEAFATLEHDGLAVTAGGAMLSDMASGRTLHAEAMPADIVRDAAAVLRADEHAVLLLKDADRAGCDYVAVTPGPDGLDPASRWWFDRHPVRVQFISELEDDPHPEWTVRVSAVAREAELAPIAEHLTDRLGDRAFLQHWSAVTSSAATGSPTHMLEVFQPGVDKWTMLQRVFDDRGIDPARCAAIGDGLNDVGMVRGAGLGIAMGNADPRVVAVSNRQTHGHEAGGVAEALDAILDGRW